MIKYQVTRPDGEVITFSSKREGIYVRFIKLDWDNKWVMSIHSSEKAARTGANQTTAWNNCQRFVKKPQSL